MSAHDLRQASSTGSFAKLVRRVASAIRGDYTVVSDVDSIFAAVDACEIKPFDVPDYVRKYVYDQEAHNVYYNYFVTRVIGVNWCASYTYAQEYTSYITKS